MLTLIFGLDLKSPWAENSKAYKPAFDRRILIRNMVQWGTIGSDGSDIGYTPLVRHPNSQMGQCLTSPTMFETPKDRGRGVY